MVDGDDDSKHELDGNLNSKLKELLIKRRDELKLVEEKRKQNAEIKKKLQKEV